MVAIIGLLSSVVLVGLGSFRARGRGRAPTCRFASNSKCFGTLLHEKQKYPSLVGGDSWSSLTNSLINAGIGVSTISNDPLSPDKTLSLRRYRRRSELRFSDYFRKTPETRPLKTIPIAGIRRSIAPIQDSAPNF